MSNGPIYARLYEEANPRPMADESVNNSQRRRPPIEAIVPLPLRNWQVIDQQERLPVVEAPIEIDGEATIVDTGVDTGVDIVSDIQPDETIAAPATPSPVSVTPADLSADQIDERIVVSLATRQQQVEAGATATYSLTLLNNGPQRAQFTLHIAQSRPTLWVAEPIPTVVLNPGERSTIPVLLTPPRAVTSRAGDYTLTFVVEADAYPERRSQLTATLTIAPFVEFKLGKISAPYRILNWWRRSVDLTAPISNSGNHPVKLWLRVQDHSGNYGVAWRTPGLRQMRTQPAQVTIPAGRMLPVTLQLYAQSQPWVGRTKRSTSIQMMAAAKGSPTGGSTEAPFIEQTALFTVGLAPVIGPWQVAALLGLFSFVVTGLGLGGLAVLIAIIVNLTQLATPSQPVNLLPTAPPSIVTILVQPAAANPLPATTVNVPGVPKVLPVVKILDAPSLAPVDEPPEVRDPAVPLVQPGQISGPDGAPAAESVAASTQAVAAGAESSDVTNAATPQSMTYAQMFQEIGLRYDLNWRMLAAQAYVESSFDSLALGSHGDLGLMQIVPPTWREWAPVVEASDPFDSYSNVLVAAVYLDHLRTALSKRGHPEREWMLVAYNWGPEKVFQHLDSGGGWDDLEPQRRQYVEEILRLAETIPPDAAF